MKISSRLILAFLFIWIGFICAISFMEAWLKFQAPGVTLPIGLGIGKLVFGALNKVEWLLCILILVLLIWEKTPKYYLFIGVVFLLSFQTFWVLPELNLRADAIINGEKLPSSNLHFYYGGAEILKFIFLLVFGFKKMNSVELKDKK